MPSDVLDPGEKPEDKDESSSAAEDLAHLDDRVHDTLAGWLADTDTGGFVTSYVTFFEFVNGNGEQCWHWATMPSQLTRTSMGLVEWGRNLLKYQQTDELDQAFYEYAEDDDD